jgi:type III secretion system low calcium response chaperone LcrH/SycD
MKRLVTVGALAPPSPNDADQSSAIGGLQPVQTHTQKQASRPALAASPRRCDIIAEAMSQYVEIENTAAQYLEFMIHGFMNGLITLQELEGISDEEMETIYALGYNFFTYGKYDAAKDIFTGLTAYAPYTAHYWRALGAVNQQLKDYVEAIAAYDMAIANDENDVVSFVYRGESQILSGNVNAGVQDLERVLQIGAQFPQFAPWVQRSELLIGLHRNGPDATGNPA